MAIYLCYPNRKCLSWQYKYINYMLDSKVAMIRFITFDIVDIR